MATTPLPKPAKPAAKPVRWRMLEATTLTGAALAGLFLIQLAAASRDLAAQAPPPQTTPATAPKALPGLDEPEVVLASDRVPKAAAPTAPAAPEGQELLHDIRPSSPTVAAVLPATIPPVTAPPSKSQAAKRPSRVLRLQATAYCPCPKCCGTKAVGVTASGLPVTYDGGAFAAADTAVLPFGTRLIIPGYAGGRPVKVIDRGGAIKGMRLDVFFPTHEQAKAWGRRWVNVTVVD